MSLIEKTTEVEIGDYILVPLILDVIKSDDQIALIPSKKECLNLWQI